MSGKAQTGLFMISYLLTYYSDCHFPELSSALLLSISSSLSTDCSSLSLRDCSVVSKEEAGLAMREKAKLLHIYTGPREHVPLNVKHYFVWKKFNSAKIKKTASAYIFGSHPPRSSWWSQVCMCVWTAGSGLLARHKRHQTLLLHHSLRLMQVVIFISMSIEPRGETTSLLANPNCS